MAYDPQRKHQRHRVSIDDGPAPVDVLLDPVPVEPQRSARPFIGAALAVVVMLAFLVARRARRRRRAGASPPS